jgi:hypothetical protein
MNIVDSLYAFFNGVKKTKKFKICLWKYARTDQCLLLRLKDRNIGPTLVNKKPIELEKKK